MHPLLSMFKKSMSRSMLKTIHKNPYTAGIAAGLLALGGVAALVMRGPQTRARTRELTDGVLRLLPGGRVAPERVALASADQPY